MKAIVKGLIFFLLISNCLNLNAQTFKWVKGGGSTADLSGSTITDWEASDFMCTDLHGNIYSLNIVGSPSIVADTFHASAYGANNAILLTSYTCNGQMRWAKLIGSGYEMKGYGLVTDNIGHIYVAGQYPNNSSYPLHIGYDTTFHAGRYLTVGLIQLDTDGHFNWMKFVGNDAVTSASNLFGNCLVVDTANNAHFFCEMNSGIVLSTGDTSVGGNYDLIYNQSGSLVRTFRLGLDSAYFLNGAVIDPTSNKLYICGENVLGHTGAVGDSFFAAAFDTGRSLLWQYFTNFGSGVTQLTIDQSKHLHFSGGTNVGVFSFNGDSVSATYYFEDMSIVMTTDTNGRSEWIKHYDCDLSVNYLGSITQLPNNKVAAAGTFAGDLSDGTHTLTSGSGQNPYFVILDSAGNVESLQLLNADGFYNGSSSIISDKAGNVCVGGYVADSIYAGTIPAYHTHGGNTDFFVMKYGVDCSCTSMPVSHYTDTGTHTVGFTYTGTTTSIDSVKWYFGDGDSSTSMTPAHTYTAAGTYNACVTVFSFCGDDTYCTDILLPCITAPTASFSDTGYSLVKHFTYTGTTTGIDSFVWHFGDGSRGTGNTIAHTYSAGTYTACVVAYNPCGVDSTCDTVTVINCTGIPSVSFTHSGATNTISFNYTGSTSYIDSAIWHFGDGSRATGLTATHTYTSAGTFTACITVYTACGNDSTCTTIVIPCVTPPVASFTSAGSTATSSFTYTGTTTSLDSVVWHFGDGGHATGTTTSHTYSDTGTFTVCVLAYNPCGVDSSCSTITIPCIASPVASFTDTGTTPVHFTYTGTTIGIDSVAWIYGDGSRGAGLTTTHSYATADTYTVCVIAYNNCGSDSSCNTVIYSIPCDTPTASFTHRGTVSDTFTYTGTTTGIDSVIWLYGDGNHGSGNTSTHSYAVSGTYHVCVIAYTNCAVDSICSDIHFTGTGVNSPLLNSIQVFPNPVTDELTITEILDATNYRLLNVAGVSLEAGVLQHGTNSVSLKGFAPGMYILEMIDRNGQKNMVKVLKE